MRGSFTVPETDQMRRWVVQAFAVVDAEGAGEARAQGRGDDPAGRFGAAPWATVPCSARMASSGASRSAHRFACTPGFGAQATSRPELLFGVRLHPARRLRRLGPGFASGRGRWWRGGAAAVELRLPR